MSIIPGPSNAIVYAQFNLQGRWKRLATIGGVYFLLIGAAVWVTAASNGRFRARDLLGWARGIMVLQTLCLLVYGAFRVESSVRGDISSRMLESHRLMPVSPLTAIIGYVVGGAMPALLLAGVNFVLGGICCAVAGLELTQWAIANAVLLCFAFFLYTLIAQFSFISRGGFLGLLIVGGILLANSGDVLLSQVPSFSVLTYPLFSPSSVFVELFNSTRLGSQSGDVSAAYVAAIGGQAAIALIAIQVGIRRYRSSNETGISASLGLLLLFVWVALANLAFSSPETFGARSYYHGYVYDQEQAAAHVVTAVVSAMLLAMIPIASASKAAARLSPKTHMPVRPPFESSPFIAALIATALICLPMLNSPVRYPAGTHGPVVVTALIVAIFILQITCLFSAGYGLRRRAWVYAIIWVAATCLAPVIADMVYRGMTDDNSNATQIMAVSPPAALALAWGGSGVSINNGILAQILFSAVPSGILLATHVKASRLPVVPAGS